MAQKLSHSLGQWHLTAECLARIPILATVLPIWFMANVHPGKKMMAHVLGSLPPYRRNLDEVLSFWLWTDSALVVVGYGTVNEQMEDLRLPLSNNMRTHKYFKKLQ